VKRTTIWAVAAVAALAMTAVIGVASASAATVLCSKAETVCADANVLPAGTNSPLGISPPNGGKFVVRGSSGAQTECHTAVVNSTSTAKWGNPLTGQAEFGVNAKNCASWQWSKESKACESIAFNKPKETYEATGGGAGIINIGSKSEPLTVSFACWSPLEGKVVECTYKANAAVPVHYNGSEGTIKKAEAATTRVSGESCDPTGSLEAALLSGIENSYISTNSATVLCSKAETVCANGNVLPAGENLPLGVAKPLGTGKFLIRGVAGGLECEYAVINSTSMAEFGDPLAGQSKFGVFANNCGIYLWGGNTVRCASMTFNSPAETIEATGAGAGVINIGSKSEPLTVAYACYSPFFEQVVECSYKASSSVPVHYDGAWGGTINKAESTMPLVSGTTGCQATVSLEAELSTGGVETFIATA
jgi:hypothetical protein